MAFPIIIISSTAPGTDTQASGAGPGDGLTTSGTPLFGTNASTSPDGLTVTLDAGTDLTNVLTDGSHVCFINDSTSSARNFGSISGKSGSGGGSPQLTITAGQAFGASLGAKAWAIGGKRLSFTGTNSKKLVDNVSNGDAMPGWTIRFKSGHTESFSTSFTFRRSGAPTTGRITIEGEAGAATMPILTQSGNFSHFTINTMTYITVQNLAFRNTLAVASKTSGAAVNTPGLGCIIKNCHADDASNTVFILVNGALAGITIEDCSATSTVSNSFSFLGAIVRNNIARSAGASGFLDSSTGRYRSTIQGNIAANCVTAGLTIGTGSATAEDSSLISNNIFHANPIGISITPAATNISVYVNTTIENNNLTANTTAGISFSGASVDSAFLLAAGTIIRYNNFGSGATANLIDITAACSAIPTNSLHVDPGYADPSTNDFSVGTNLKAQGWPQVKIGGLATGTRNYMDIAAGQRQEVGSGGDTYLILSGV